MFSRSTSEVKGHIFSPRSEFVADLGVHLDLPCVRGRIQRRRLKYSPRSTSGSDSENMSVFLTPEVDLGNSEVVSSRLGESLCRCFSSFLPPVFQNRPRNPTNTEVIRQYNTHIPFHFHSMQIIVPQKLTLCLAGGFLKTDVL